MNNENKPSVIAELTAALASMAERAAAAEAEAEQYKKSSGEWYQFFTSKDKELRDTQAELQKARKALEAKEGEQNHGNDKESKGVAFVEKTPEPMKPLRKPDRQGRFLACYTKAGQPDFKGTLTGGRAVVFEAKHTDSDKIDQSRLTPEQVESLTLHHKLGAAAFIMVSVGLENFYRVPWEVWRDMKQIYGRKHMKLEDLEPYRVQYIAGILKLLEGVEIDYAEEGDTP